MKVKLMIMNNNSNQMIKSNVKALERFRSNNLVKKKT